MAQAEDQSVPRKTSNYKKFSGMASQNERYNVKDDEFFWLENIMRVGPRKLRSVPGPGVAIPIVGPPVPPEVCIPNPQNLKEFDWYDLDSPLTGPPNSGSGYRAAWGFVSADTSIISERDEPKFIGFGNPRYNNDTYVKVFRAQHGIAPEVQKVIGNGSANNITPADGEIPLHSDESSYIIYTNAGFFYFSFDTQTVTFFQKPANYFPFKVNSAAKSGSDVYAVVNHGVFGGDHIGYLVHFTSGGTFIGDSSLLTGYARTPALHCTTNFLYALSTDSSGLYFIDKIARNNLNVSVATYSLGLPQIASMFVVDDTLIYFLQQINGLLVDIYFWHANVITHLNTGGSIVITPGIQPAPGSGNQDTRYNFWYRSPFFYYGSNGFAGFSVSITKIGPLVC